MDDLNTEVLFSSKEEKWETPQDFFDKLILRLMQQHRPITPNAPIILRKNKMDLLKVGVDIQCGAIHPIVARQDYGLRKHTKSINAPGVLWSCYCLQELM